MTTQAEPLEDDFTWVLRKALKALELAPSQLAELAAVAPPEVLAFSRGRFSADLARRLAPHLALHPEAFAGHPDYAPCPSLPPGLARLAFPFDEGFTNAWMISRDGVAVLIDTGTGARGITQRLGDAGELQVFITHPHGDHVGGLAALRDHPHTLHAPPAAGFPGAAAARPGQTLDLGPLQVAVLDLDGHWPGHLGYRIDGLAIPLCAVGDALFAGSLGGTPDGTRHATELGLVRATLDSLPPETILLPGHGPPTTVALELEHNPFLAV